MASHLPDFIAARRHFEPAKVSGAVQKNNEEAPKCRE
jgi:hypothetical protein